ncbi:MAG: hypothetical protein LCH61_20780, partial [Proteobacteria bacterium]|nr:hypothetical protein [Pseudomonadota bacterium]
NLPRFAFCNPAPASVVLPAMIRSMVEVAAFVCFVPVLAPVRAFVGFQIPVSHGIPQEVL